ncbi:TdiE [Drepanopeziza brunnea f. sp. 'multigermtubi' MB_m1]|uniref:TdiE n=1 Tax=Marssonina brunnea f. sp. multigermtubi (strain MB_m1) TaxID=1072389 RepID=K1XJP9_MARBU|nr:TdiE [Drepanopeziza brunnea f. sp. 'multigermtubi' MB_m1]EKD12614.1 TdiE [Drepanopeziza brunnea f. sp. 'multigermtubi' MB_m1]
MCRIRLLTWSKADDHPSAKVLGTDLSPNQPDLSVPPNLSFMIDDATEEWIFNNHFDFIHSCQWHCAVEERRLMAQALEHIKPGGWLAMQELCIPARCDDGSKWMMAAGFTDVHSSLYKWPSNTWPKREKEKTLGLWNMVNTLDGVEVLGWQPEEAQLFLAGVRKDTKNKKLHNYWPISVLHPFKKARVVEDQCFQPMKHKGNNICSTGQRQALPRDQKDQPS